MFALSDVAKGPLWAVGCEKNWSTVVSACHER